MKLTCYGYNAFVIEGEGKTIILDPGQDLDRRLDSLTPLEAGGGRFFLAT